MSGFPIALTLRMALTTTPLATPTWATQSISKLLEGVHIDRSSRTSELESFSAGGATLPLDNRLREYDPANTSGANYGNLLPRKRVNLRATFSATTYDLIDGFVVPNWPQQWDTLMGTVPLPIVDAFGLFSNATVSTGLDADGDPVVRPQERSDQRLGWLLDQYGWPAGWRTFDTGVVDVEAAAYQGENLLQALQDVERAEGGFLFMDGAGNVVFQNKYARVTAFQSSQATFGENAGELDYESIDYVPQDVEHLINKAEGKQAGQDPVVSYSDASSITAYGPSTPAGGTIELTAALLNEVESRVQYLVGRYSQPAVRIRSITFKPLSDQTNLMPHALGRAIGERITINQRFFGKGSALSHVCRIEGIHHDIDYEDWTTTFDLSPVVSGIDSGSYWSLGAVGSQLGGNTVLIF